MLAKGLFVGDDKGLDPLYNTLGSISDNMVAFNKNYDGFFDTVKAKEGAKYIQDHKDALYKIDIDSVLQVTKGLDDGLLTMNEIHSDLSSTTQCIIAQVNAVTDLYNRWSQVTDHLTDDQNKAAFWAGVKTLDKMLTDAINETNDISNKLFDVQQHMIDVNTGFTGLKVKIEKALQPKSDYKNEAVKAYLDSIGICSGLCIGMFILGPLVGLGACGICIAAFGHAKVQEIVDRIQKELEASNKEIENFKTYFELFAQTATKLGQQAAADKVAVDEFNTFIKTAEDYIHAQISINFLRSAKDRVMEQMVPLRDACNDLMKKINTPVSTQVE